MNMPKEYKSPRFKCMADVHEYFKDSADSGILDAIRFLASEVERLQYSLEHLDNEYRGYDP